MQYPHTISHVSKRSYLRTHQAPSKEEVKRARQQQAARDRVIFEARRASEEAKVNAELAELTPEQAQQAIALAAQAFAPSESGASEGFKARHRRIREAIATLRAEGPAEREVRWARIRAAIQDADTKHLVVPASAGLPGPLGVARPVSSASENIKPELNSDQPDEGGMDTA